MTCFVHNSDVWVLQTVQGFHIEFYGSLVQPSHPRPPAFFDSLRTLIDEEISALLRKGAIAITSLHPEGFLSNIFLVEKQDWGFRPFINLREFNEWLVYRHFKLEGIHLLPHLLRAGDWMVRLDVKDAYLTIPIFPPHHHFLQFWWG